MRYDDAFWCSGRARGVDDVGRVARVEGCGGRASRLARDLRPLDVEPDDRRRLAWPRPQPLRQAGLRHQHGGLRVGEHERQPLRRVAGIERQVGGAGLEDAEQPDHHLGRALKTQAHHGLGPDARATADDAPAGWHAPRARRSAARAPRTPAPARPACAKPARANSSGRVAAATGCAVAFHSSRMVLPLRGRQHLKRPDRAIRRLKSA